MNGAFYTIVTFTFVFVFLLGLYGASTGLPAVTTPLNQLNAPWPRFFIGQCSAAVFCVNQIGDFLYSTFSIIGSFLVRLGAILALIYGIDVVLGSYSGLPWLGWFFGLLIFISAIEGWVLLRHGRPT